VLGAAARRPRGARMVSVCTVLLRLAAAGRLITVGPPRIGVRAGRAPPAPGM